MKKAKIVLSAVALFAVVGGALAFKASKFGGGNVYIPTTTTFGTVYCSNIATLKTTLPQNGIASTVYTSAFDDGRCPTSAPLATFVTTTL